MNIKEIQKQINDNAEVKGFWDKGIELEKKLLLVVSEVVEAMEADRSDKYCEVNMDVVNGWVSDENFVKHYKEQVKDTFEDEIAGATIRLFDLAYKMGFDLEKHIEAAHRYNTTRPYKHGKKY